MAKTLGMLFGIVFLLVGILGFVPGISPPDANGMPMLLHIFMVNTVHSVVHIASGLIFLLASMAGQGQRGSGFGFSVLCMRLSPSSAS